MIQLAGYAGKQFERGLILYSGREVLPFKYGERTFHAVPIGAVLSGTPDRVAVP